MVGGQCSQKTDAGYSSVPKCNLKRRFSVTRDAKTVSTSVSHPCPLLSLSLPYPSFVSLSQKTLYPAKISVTLISNGTCLNQDCSAGPITQSNYVAGIHLKRFGSARPGLHEEAPALHLLPHPAQSAALLR